MTTPWGTTGVQARWTGEAVAATQDKEPLQEINIRLSKLSVLVPMTEELLEDAPAMGTFVAKKAGEAIDFKISDAIAYGNGAGQPLGFMNSPVIISQAKESGQTADTIVAANVTKMQGRLPVQMWRNAVWLIHPDALNQLPLMVIGDQPVYLPPGGIRGDVFGNLLGFPVIPHQVNQTLGDEGDIMLVALDQYLTAVKAGGVRSQTSIHLWFDQGITAFRFDLRIAGQPWWSEVTTAKNGSFTQSPFITLAERA
jgi:HK97 family phage major capsid protein